jgi:purine nucleosidase
MDLKGVEDIIIDCDPGIDDALALLLALASPLIRIHALTIVHGNLVDLGQLGGNAAAIVELARLHSTRKIAQHVPVYLGAAKPLVRCANSGAAFVHGANGLGNVILPPPSVPPVDPSICTAAQAIVSLCREYPGRLTLVAIGPLTNLATALLLDPALPSRVKRVIIMGGAFQTHGNITPLAEANVYNDPEAAQAVFSADWDITLAPLNVCRGLVLSPERLSPLAGLNPIGAFVSNIHEFYAGFYRTVVGTGYFPVSGGRRARAAWAKGVRYRYTSVYVGSVAPRPAPFSRAHATAGARFVRNPRAHTPGGLPVG